MLPVIAIVGRPNVGKSTLFNRLTAKRDALVADQPGLTRDRIYGLGRIGDRPYIVVDTGGLTVENGLTMQDGSVVESGLTGKDRSMARLMEQQVIRAIEEADTLILLVDGRAGLTAADEDITAWLRRYGKPIYLAVNKSEGLDPEICCAEFYRLGLEQTMAITATHGQGIVSMMEYVLATLPDERDIIPETSQDGVKIAVAGRPNAGKSTLINRMLGEQRVLVSEIPGTTRDSIYIPFERGGHKYILIDTAGVRRRKSVIATIEKFSVIKTLQAIAEANVVLLVLDAHQGIGVQDASLLGHIVASGRALVIVVNKWDGLEEGQRNRVKVELERKLVFVDFAKIHFISALYGSGVGDLFGLMGKAYRSAIMDFPTSQLTKVLQHAISAHPPTLARGRRIKLRYAHQGGKNPPLIIIHGNQTDAVPKSYRRYLANTFRSTLKLTGTPLRIEFRSGENPFQGRKNPLTKRQKVKRRRLIRYVKGKG